MIHRRRIHRRYRVLSHSMQSKLPSVWATHGFTCSGESVIGTATQLQSVQEMRTCGAEYQVEACADVLVPGCCLPRC